MSKAKKEQQVTEEEIPEIKTDDQTQNTADENDDTVSDLLKKLAELKKLADGEKTRADDMTSVAARLRADFDNYRKRTESTAAKERDIGRAEVIEKFIPVLDVVEQAIGMINDTSVKNGVVMIRRQMEALLSAFGVSEVAADGEFDPKIHEAIMRAPCETPDQAGTIKEVFQKGYTMGDRLLRPARVIVYND